MLLTIEYCYAIVADKRAVFMKNTRRCIQILDPSEEGKFIEESAVSQTTPNFGNSFPLL